MNPIVLMGVAHSIATPPMVGPIPSAPSSPLLELEMDRRNPDRNGHTSARRGPVHNKHRGTRTSGWTWVPRWNQPPAKEVIHRAR